MRRGLVIIGSMLALLFVSQNLEPVEISLVLGRPVEAPLALVISAAFFGGFVTGITVLLSGRLRRKRSPDDDEDGIEDETGR